MNDWDTLRARERMLAGEPPRGVRPPIGESWSRARRHGLRPDAYLPPVPLGEDDVRERRDGHPLAAVWPVLRNSLLGVTADPANLLFLSDAEGHLLWLNGEPASLVRAERAHLLPGALWSEAAAGTSGVGTALALRRPFQVRGAEHFLSAAVDYTCTAVPIRDPTGGDVLGVLNLTCRRQQHEAMVMSLLVTSARLAEAQLRGIRLRELARSRERYASRLSRLVGAHAALVAADGAVLLANPTGWLPRRVAPPRQGDQVLDDGRPVVVERLAAAGPYLLVADRSVDRAGLPVGFAGLGRHTARLVLAGAPHDLRGRHSDIVAILLAHPEGMPARELCPAVYGPAGRAVTLRAELTRLRAVLGRRLASEPYRIVGESRADFLDLEREVVDAPVAELLERYRGPLLPYSRAPGVVALRERLHERVARRVLASGDAAAIRRWRSG
ncbi:GAF domain-containing protein [Amycolatopsis arida]|uniref:GAF domain-containing protein n=1 Tax=Amycolatopsis arida TaxID=587909 RepID=A0A1I5ZSV8_9PSEU|nr:GAF domain-containing protein [Amycolatopsis arida]TDX89344.1 GAF domain-containing protein [Amycolatopsis arida]SFQ59521.1 GAF domain-containing protein [Amycolatopsis arida]